MPSTMDEQTVQDELADAHAARARGNEGMARVCARRAAGWTVALVRGDQIPSEISGNAYQLLRWYAQRGEEGPKLRRAAERLTVRITEDHSLPHPEDPLKDAEFIVNSLLGDTPDRSSAGGS